MVHKVKYGASSAVLVLIVAGILIATNVIGARLFTRLDLTEDKEFTISEATKRVLGRLDDRVLCKLYISRNLPEQLTTLEQTVEDVLKEYQVYSDGKLRVQYIDPTDDEDLRGAATAAGIPQIQVNVLEQDQYQIKNVFLGAALEYGGKVEAIPVLDTGTLEYDMTAAIVKLTLPKRPTIGFLTGHGERDLQTELNGLTELLQERYETRPVDLSGGALPVSDDIDVLVVAGPEGVGERERYELDQYLMRGGRLVLLDDVIALNEQMGLQAIPKSSGLRELIGFYGCEVQNGLVMEHPRYSAQARFSQGFISYLVPYPLWPRSGPGLLNPSNPITAQLESTVLPFTAPLTLTVPGDENREMEAESRGETEPVVNGAQPDVEGTVLVRTTERAWVQRGRYDLNPQSPTAQQAPPTGESYPLVVSLQGSFRSFFEGKPVPPVEGSTEAAPGDSTITASPETQLLVAGSSTWLTNQFLQMYPENTLLVQNALDWLTLGDDLIEIRSRGATARPIERELSNAKKNLIKFANTFGTAAVVVLLGLLWNGARRRSRQKLTEQFNG